MKTILTAAAFITAFAFTDAETLTGKWESISATGTITGIIFKNDNSFEGSINKKPFVSGTYNYSQEDNLLSFTDNGCDGMKGIYKISFYSGVDSFRFQLISDSCTQRAEGMQRLRMGRVNNEQKDFKPNFRMK